MTKYALVTGASSGIGYEYAVVLAEKCYSLVIVSNEEAVNDKAEELRRLFPQIDVLPVVMDLGRQEAAKELYDWCHEKRLDVEVLVNNAGVYHDRDFLDDSAEFTQLILNLHVMTPVMLQYYFGQDMLKCGKGYVLNMSSVTSDYGIQRMSTYASTKGFLRLFSRSTHIELKKRGVIVTCVRPGAVATPLYNLNDRVRKAGLAVGAIIPPRKLAEKGVKAMFRGRHVITPGLFTKVLELVPFLPVWLLKLIRSWGWF